MLSLVLPREIVPTSKPLAPLEIHTHVYWVLSLACRNRLPPELENEVVTCGVALRQLARIHRDESVQDRALVNQVARLIEQVVLNPTLPSSI